MTNKFIKLFCGWALAVCAMGTSAAECTAQSACEFYLNKQGDLLRASKNGGSPIPLFAGAGAAAMTASQYVMSRSGRYFLVREYSGNDKSFVIVPLDVSERSVTFTRILSFSLMQKESTESGREVWSGDEIGLKRPSDIKAFSWARVFEWLGKVEPSTDGEAGNVLQHGFSAIPLTIHDAAGAITGQRAYLYADKLGATPESIVCIARCVTDTASPMGAFRGGIGKYPVTLTLTAEQQRITGTYRYDGKPGILNLDGSLQEGDAIAMTEHPTGQPTRVTGKLDAILSDGMYLGLWTSPSKGTQLPFFAVIDSL